MLADLKAFIDHHIIPHLVSQGLGSLGVRGISPLSFRGWGVARVWPGVHDEWDLSTDPPEGSLTLIK